MGGGDGKGKGREEGLQNPNFETVPKTGKKVKGTGGERGKSSPEDGLRGLLVVFRALSKSSFHQCSVDGHQLEEKTKRNISE